MIAVIDICGYAPVHVMTMDPMMLDGSGGGRARSRLGDGREEGGREGDGREGGQPLSGHKLRADDMGSRARILRHSCSFAGCFERTRTAASTRDTLEIRASVVLLAPGSRPTRATVCSRCMLHGKCVYPTLYLSKLTVTVWLIMDRSDMRSHALLFAAPCGAPGG